MPKAKIETYDQFVREYEKIRTKTRWSLRRIALEGRIVPETLRKIVEGITESPGKPVCHKLAVLADRVRVMK